MGFSGCATTSYTTTEYNPETKEYEIVEYSGYFEGESILVKDKVRASCTVLLDDKKSPKKETLVLGQNTLADFQIYIFTTGRQSMPFRLDSVKIAQDNRNRTILRQPRDLRLIPKSVAKVSFEKTIIQNPELQLDVILNYTTSSGRESKKIELRRLTREEYKERKKKPWQNITGNIL